MLAIPPFASDLLRLSFLFTQRLANMYFTTAFITSLLAASTVVSAAPLERRDVKMMAQTQLDAAGAAYCESIIPLELLAGI